MIFSVCDNGKGILEKCLLDLFDIFVVEVRECFDMLCGLGFGLLICMLIIWVYDGILEVKNNKYGGVIFWFILLLDGGDGKWIVNDLC